MFFRFLSGRRFGMTFAPPIGFLFEGPAAGGGAPGGGAAAAPAGAAPTSPTSPTAGAPAASSPTGAAPAWTPPKDKAEYDAALEAARRDARVNFVPSHRLTEETGKRQGLERDLATAQQRIRALSGLETLSPEQSEAKKVRDAFFEMFPEFKALASLSPERLANLDRALENGSAAGDVVRNHWDNHAARVFDAVASQIETALGIDGQMSDRQYAGMVNSFRGWARDRIQVDPKFQQRYEAADPALLSEFVKEFTEDWITPSRRLAVASVVNRPRVPSGGRTPAITAPAPNLENVKTPEEAEDVGIAYMRGRGVNFAG